MDGAGKKGMQAVRVLFRVLQGAFIGIGAMMPGISGGVLCVLFGIYRPMMEFLSHPVRTFKTAFRLLLPILVGWVIGFWAVSGLLSRFFEAAETYAIFLFVGLIVGTLPSLWRTAGERGRGKGSFLSMGVCFALSLFLMLFFSGKEALSVAPNLFWWLVCGLLWGISLIVPGLSSSAFLLYIGLYQKMTAGIFAVDLGVILPMLFGIILVVVLLTRLVSSLFEKHSSVLYHALFGIVCASAIAIVPHGETVEYTAQTIPVYVLCAVGGLFVALGMDLLGKKLMPKEEPTES